MATDVIKNKKNIALKEKLYNGSYCFPNELEIIFLANLAREINETGISNKKK